jgi:hypothetical protein
MRRIVGHVRGALVARAMRIGQIAIEVAARISSLANTRT